MVVQMTVGGALIYWLPIRPIKLKKKSLKKHELNKKEIIKMKRAKALSGTPLPIWLRTWLKP